MYWASLNIFVVLLLVAVGLLILPVGELQVVTVLIYLLLKGPFNVFSPNENSNTLRLFNSPTRTAIAFAPPPSPP